MHENYTEIAVRRRTMIRILEEPFCNFVIMQRLALTDPAVVHSISRENVAHVY